MTNQKEIQNAFEDWQRRKMRVMKRTFKGILPRREARVILK